MASGVAGRAPGRSQAGPRHSPDANGVRAVQVRAGGLGAAALNPLGGSADVLVGRGAFIYLASQSPRRRQLLEQIGVAHRPLLADAEEDVEALEAEIAGELPAHYVERVTRAKLGAARRRLAQRRLPLAPILCADTTVALGRRLLGKPRDAAQAIETLALLAGRTHRVLTAVALWDGRRTRLALSTSRVRFAAMPCAAIEGYVASGEAFGKAGAYAIQGPIAAWIERVEGSYSGIMGLPLYETAQLLRQAHVPR